MEVLSGDLLLKVQQKYVQPSVVPPQTTATCWTGALASRLLASEHAFGDG